MTLVRFACRADLPLRPDEIAGQILDIARWTEFHGYGPLPGIRSATFEVRTDAVVGSRIRVVNTDGSSHVEEIVEWQPPRRLKLHMHEFSPPVSRLATAFDETWEFDCRDGVSHVVRSFEMHPASAFTRPVLWLISWLLKRAIARHLRQMREAGL